MTKLDPVVKENLSRKTVSHLFEVHMLSEDGKTKARELAANFDDLLAEVEKLCGQDGREMAIVRTKLEEACFFAKKAMAGRKENQQA